MDLIHVWELESETYNWELAQSNKFEKEKHTPQDRCDIICGLFPMQLSLWRVKNQAISPGLSHVGHCLEDRPCYTHPRAGQDSSPQVPKDTHLRQCWGHPHPILPLEPKTQDLSRWGQSRIGADALVIAKLETKVECLWENAFTYCLTHQHRWPHFVALWGKQGRIIF